MCAPSAVVTCSGGSLQCGKRRPGRSSAVIAGARACSRCRAVCLFKPDAGSSSGENLFVCSRRVN